MPLQCPYLGKLHLKGLDAKKRSEEASPFSISDSKESLVGYSQNCGPFSVIGCNMAPRIWGYQNGTPILGTTLVISSANMLVATRTYIICMVAGWGCKVTVSGFALRFLLDSRVSSMKALLSFPSSGPRHSFVVCILDVLCDPSRYMQLQIPKSRKDVK